MSNMENQSFEIAKIIIGSTGFLGLAIAFCVLIFRTGKMMQKFETMDQKINDIENKMDICFKRVDDRFEKLEKSIDDRFEKFQKTIDHKFEKLEQKIPEITISIRCLEIRLEERTLRTIDAPKKEIQ